jgi:hypothetical protein
MMRELRCPLDRISIFRDQEKVGDEDLLVDEEYLVFVNE